MFSFVAGLHQVKAEFVDENCLHAEWFTSMMCGRKQEFPHSRDACSPVVAGKSLPASIGGCFWALNIGVEAREAVNVPMHGTESMAG